MYRCRPMNNMIMVDIIVSPKSSRQGVQMDDSGRIKVYLNSPPVDGKANEECLKLLSKTLGVAKTMISIERGASGRKKTLKIFGISREELAERIGKADLKK